MALDKNQQAFITLVRAGLWEKEARLSQYGNMDFMEVYRLSEEQSVVGLVAAGLEHVEDSLAPQEIALRFVGTTLQIEQRNTSMNKFITFLTEQLRKDNIRFLLVKGQGIAQCYERPLWRSSGDVDLFLDEVNYTKAADSLSVLASKIDKENSIIKHLGLTINSWDVELHGTLCSQIRKSVDKGLIEVQKDTFKNNKYRVWNNNGCDVFLPSPGDDVIFIFAHIYQHFFKEGIGLRQICDWCRLLWMYKDEIDYSLLELRLKRMRLMDKWLAFAALAVVYLGMPVDAMPFNSSSKKWKKKADGIIALIMESGNFGHAADRSYKYKYPVVIRALAAFCHHSSVAFKHFLIFPFDSFLGWARLVYLGIKANLRK